MLKYKLSLINVWWSQNQQDTRYFNSLNDQQQYFEAKTNGRKTVFVNFNMGDNINTSVIYRDNSGRSVDELMRCNYCVVYQYNDNEELINTRYYFAKCRQDSNKQLVVDLTLDSIQTDYFKHKETIKPCLIKRAHLNRWIDDLYNPSIPGVKTFNTLPNSLLFKNEGFNEIPKKVDKRLTTTPAWTGNTDVDNWLKENVKYWLYVYVNNRSDDNDTFHNFKCYDILTNTNNEITTKILNTSTQLKNAKGLSINYGLLCYPIYNIGSKKIKINNGQGDTFTLDIADYTGEGIANFKTRNNNTSFIFCEKLSCLSPIHNNYNNITIGSDGNLYIDRYATIGLPNGQIGIGSALVTRFSEANYGYCSITQTGSSDNYTFNFALDGYKMRYNVNEIVNAEHNPLLNPKYYSSDIMTLTLHGNADNGFDYDLLKLGQTSYLSIEYSEVLQPEITRYFARFKLPLLNGLLVEEQNNNFIGDVANIDATLPLANTKYADFIANNKNFWLQQNTNLAIDVAKGAMTSANAFIQGDKVKGIMGSVSTALDTGATLVNTFANVGNLKNSPGSLKNASSNILFAGAVDDLNIKVTVKKALECDIKSYDDYINKFGFNTGIVDNISNYDNIRYYFNYIEAEVESITADLPEIEKEDLRRRLSAIRFWNTDNVQYTMENFENYLLEEINNGN